MDPLRFFANLVLTFILILILVLPFGLSFNFFKVSPTRRTSSGTVLSASDRSFGGYLLYNTSPLEINKLTEITAFAFPGQPVFYNNIFTINNKTSKSQNYKIIVLESAIGEAVATFYFGAELGRQAVTLKPEETTSLNLKIDTSSPKNGGPFPLKLQFLIKAF